MAKIINLIGRTMGGKDKRNKITKIARHHSATSTGDVFSFENYWKNTRKWNTGGYHEVILRNGDVQVCYTPETVTNGVYGHNQTAYHICLVGNGDFTEAQEKSFDERVKFNIERFGLKIDDVLGHNEFSGQNTTCPGIDMNSVRNRLKSDSKKEPKKETTTNAKTIGQMAQEIIDGRHGLGHDKRRKSLGISPSEYEKVRAEVNRRLNVSKKKEPKKSLDTMIQEVIDGKHGNGHATRRKSLGISAAEYLAVRQGVNKRLSKQGNQKSIEQMAKEVIAGKHGNGHENRRKSLGISKEEYAKVRKEVNRRL